jgi:hypothetical protein
VGSATSSRGVLRAWRDRGAAAVILEDVAVMMGFGIGAWTTGYMFGFTILYMRKFFEQV